MEGLRQMRRVFLDKCQARTQGGFTVANEPPRSFKFRFKFNGICMRAHCARARFRDRSAMFHRMRMHACDVHSTFKDLIVAERARPCSSCSGIRGGELLSGRGQGGSFRCKTVSSASVRKGAMMRRRASTATLFSQQNEEHPV